MSGFTTTGQTQAHQRLEQIEGYRERNREPRKGGHWVIEQISGGKRHRDAVGIGHVKFDGLWCVSDPE